MPKRREETQPYCDSGFQYHNRLETDRVDAQPGQNCSGDHHDGQDEQNTVYQFLANLADGLRGFGSFFGHDSYGDLTCQGGPARAFVYG